MSNYKVLLKTPVALTHFNFEPGQRINLEKHSNSRERVIVENIPQRRRSKLSTPGILKEIPEVQQIIV